MKKHHTLYYVYWSIKLSIFSWLARHEPDMGNFMKLQEWFGLISDDGSPRHCCVCGHDHFGEKNHYYINEGQVCEYSAYCQCCNTVNGHWAYGNWTV